MWSRENKKALNQTFWKRPKCWKVIDSPLLNTPAQNRGKLHTESNWCTKSKMSWQEEQTRTATFLSHFTHWQLQAALWAKYELDSVLLLTTKWKQHTAEQVVWSWSTFSAQNWPLICLNHVPALWQQPPPKAFMMHSTKDIKRRVCPADHRRRWGDGAWSGWCSASGRSRLHIRLRLQKKTNAHVLELGVAAVKRRRFTKTHATLSDKTCSDGENSSACLSSNTINQSTSH